MRRSGICFVLLLLVAVMGGGCGTLGDRIDAQIELVGSELTEAPVSVDEVNLHIAQGFGEVKGLRIANPEGYVTEYAMTWELLNLDLGILSTLAGEPIAIDRLVISYPVVNLEKNQHGGSNLADITENVERNQERADQKSAEVEPASEEAPGEPVRLVIRDLRIEGVTLNVRTIDGTTRSAILPTISLIDVGGTEGITPGGLGVVVIGAMTGEMLKQVVARELLERAGNIQDALSTDNILEVLDHRLYLRPEQREKIRPAVDRLSSALIETIDVWVGQGFVDLDELNQQLKPVLADIKIRFEAFLDSEQFNQLDEVISRLEDNAVEIIRHVAVMQVSKRLELTPEQVTQLRPIVHQNLVRVSDLFHEAAENSDLSLENFLASYEELDIDLREQLAEKLSSEQIAQLAVLQGDILTRVRTALGGVLQ